MFRSHHSVEIVHSDGTVSVVDTGVSYQDADAILSMARMAGCMASHVVTYVPMGDIRSEFPHFTDREFQMVEELAAKLADPFSEYDV